MIFARLTPCILVGLFMISCLWNSCVYAQTTIWLEDFESYANHPAIQGLDNNLPNGVDWNTSATDCDDGGVNVAGNRWGTEVNGGNTEFVCWDIEGSCCGTGGGQADNIFRTEVIDISNKGLVEISIGLRIEGDMECDPTDCNTGDRIEFEYALNGGPFQAFCTPIDYCNGVNNGYRDITQKCLTGNSLQIRITMGNKAQDEFFFIDNIRVTGDNTPPKFANLNASSTTLCSGGTTNLLASGGDSYAWVGPIAGLSCTDCPNPTATVNETTTFSVQVTDNATCCKDIASITINTSSSDGLVVTADPPDVCSGQSTKLQASGANTYKWLTNTGDLSCTNCRSPQATPSGAARTYEVEGTDINGCKSTGDVTVRIIQRPDAQIFVNIPDPCLGDIVEMISDGGPHHKWIRYTEGLSCTACNAPRFVATEPVTYTVRIGPEGCSDIAEISFDPKPSPIARQGAGGKVCGQSFTTSATLEPGQLGEWNQISGPGTSLFSNQDQPVTKITATEFGTYEYQWVVYSNGCSDTGRFFVEYTSFPEADAGVDEFKCGQETKTTANLETGERGNWTVISSAGNPSFGTINNPKTRFSGESFGLYELQWEVEKNGCKDRDTVNIIFNREAIADPGVDTVVCGKNIQLRANELFDDEVGEWALVFGPGSCFFEDNSKSATKATVSVEGEYVFSWHVVNGVCDSMATKVVEFIKIPTADVGLKDTSVCGIDHQMAAVLTGNSFGVWSKISPEGSSIAFRNKADPKTRVTASALDTFLLAWTVTENGCSAIDTARVVFNDGPVAPAGNDTIACGLEFVFNAETYPGATSRWSLIDGTGAIVRFDDIKQFDTKVAVGDYGSYTFNWNVELGECRSDDQITVEFVDFPNVAISGATQMCEGDSVLLTASSNAKQPIYNWSPDTFFTDKTGENVFASPKHNEPVFVTVQDGVSLCETDTFHTIGVFSLPIIDAGEDAVTCSDKFVELNGEFDKGVISWKPTDIIDDPSSPSTVAFPSEDVFIVFESLSEDGCTARDSFFIDVRPAPLANAGDDMSICEDAFDELKGSGGASYSWAPTTGLNDANIANPTVAAPDGAITYILTAAVGNCFDYDTITVTGIPKIPVNAMGDTVICINTNAQLSAAPGFVSYRWEPSTAVDNPNARNVNVAPLVETVFTITTTTEDGCLNSDSVIVRVNELPIAFGELDTTICVEQLITLGANPTGIGEGPLNYVWSPNDGNISNTSDPNPTFLSNQSGVYDYELFVTDNIGCKSNVERIHIENVEQISFEVKELAPLCTGETATFDVVNLSGGTGDYTYSWQPDHLSWKSATDIPSPTAELSASVVLTLTISDDQTACRNTSTQLIEVLPDFTIDAGTDQLVCANTEVQLGNIPLIEGQTGPYTIIWSPNTNFINGTSSSDENPMVLIDTTITYIVRATDEKDACTNSDTVVIRATPPFNIIIDTLSSYNFCKGDTVYLGSDSTARGGSGYANLTYSWRAENVEWITATNIENPVAIITTSTSFSLTVLDGVTQCDSTVSLPLSVAADYESLLDPSYKLCDAEIENILKLAPFVTGGFSDNYTYLYGFEGGTLDTITGSWLSFPKGLNPMIYTMQSVVTDNILGCTDTFYFDVKVAKTDTVDAGFLQTMDQGDFAILESDADENWEIAWEPSDSVVCADCPVTVVKPEETTIYTISILNDEGCPASDTVSVRVYTPCEFVAPTAFSPNGDGINDVFYVRTGYNAEPQHFLFEVFNTWGQTVFSTRDINEGWDGTFAGEAQPSNTYLYQISSLCRLKRYYEGDGKILLTR